MVLAPVMSNAIFHQSGTFVDCPPLLQRVHAWDFLFICTTISSISVWLLTRLILKRCGKCQDLCIPWVHFSPLILTRDVGVQLLRRNEKSIWSDVGIIAISCMHIALDGLHSSIEVSIRARQECIHNLAPVGLNIVRMVIFDNGLKMALDGLAHLDNIAFVILKLGSLNGLAMKLHVD